MTLCRCTSPRLPFTRSWSNKDEISKFTKNQRLDETQKFFALSHLVPNKEYLGQKVGFMSKRELKYARFLSLRGQREAICFPNLTLLMQEGGGVSRVNIRELKNHDDDSDDDDRK